MSQGWVGTIVGAVGAGVGVLGLLLYRRSRIPGIITFQSRNVSLIGGGRTMLPGDIKVLYRDTEVPRLTSSTIWFWNAGKTTVRGEDIVRIDPLRLRFGGEVLNVRVEKVSREAIQITTETPDGKRNTVGCGFDFLDPGDGAVLKVLHSGAAATPEFEGTIKSMPKGPQHWGSASSRMARKFEWFFSVMFLILGFLVIAPGILGEQYFLEVLSIPKSDSKWPIWFDILFGLLVILISIFRMRTLRRRPPSSLEMG